MTRFEKIVRAENPDFLTTTEAARRLKTTVYALHSHIRHGNIKVHKVSTTIHASGHVYAIHKDDLAAFKREKPAKYKRFKKRMSNEEAPLSNAVVETVNEGFTYMTVYAINPGTSQKMQVEEPHITLCHYKHDGVEDIGIAICSFDDQFDAERGKQIARGRAMHISRHNGKVKRWEAHMILHLTGEKALHRLVASKGKSFRLNGD